MNTDEVTEKIIGCAMKVSNTLGIGFLEKVYENAVVLELGKAAIRVEQQKHLQVVYDGVVVGEYTADLVIKGSIIVELKAVRAIDEVHQAQLLNYLRASGLHVGLILNFGTQKLGIKRLVL